MLRIFLNMKKKKKIIISQEEWVILQVTVILNTKVEEEHLYKTRPYLKNIINNLKKSDAWKIKLTIANNFIPSLGNAEERVMHLKCDNVEIMINDEPDEVTKELFGLLKNSLKLEIKI